MRRAAAAALLCLSACANYGTRLSPRSIAPGDYEVNLSADVIVVDRGVGPQLLGLPELSLRRGLSQDLDLGFRLSPLGLGADARWTLIRGPKLALAWVLGPSFDFVAVTNRDVDLVHYTLNNSLLAGWQVGRSFEWVLAAHAHSELRQGAGKFRFVQVLGASSRLSWTLSDSVALAPTVGVFVPFDPKRADIGSVAFRGGLTLSFR